MENAQFQYGVQNLTLCILRTITIRIGHWSRVEAADDVLKVQSLSCETLVFGPRYQEVTKKCLRCDFGYGENLSQPCLQQAICESLVCELNNMIEAPDIN